MIEIREVQDTDCTAISAGFAEQGWHKPIIVQSNGAGVLLWMIG